MDNQRWVWDVEDYVELGVFNFGDIVCRDRIEIFGNDLKSMKNVDSGFSHKSNQLVYRN